MIQVWDLATRLYHWIQALLVIWLLATGLSGSGDSTGHLLAGAIVAVALIWRLVWGVVGSETARFTSFVPGPVTLVRYLRQGEQSRPGHSPLGALMVCLLLALLCFQLISGWMMSPLGASLLERDSVHLAEVVHGVLVLVVVGALCVHLTAIALFQWKGHALVQGMVTGYLRFDGPEPRFVRGRWAVLVLLTCLLGVAMIAAPLFV